MFRVCSVLGARILWISVVAVSPKRTGTCLGPCITCLVLFWVPETLPRSSSASRVKDMAWQQLRVSGIGVSALTLGLSRRSIGFRGLGA